MKLTTLVLTGTACVALAAAAPAAAAPRDDTPQAPQGQALYPETVPGAGLTGVAGAQATIHHVVLGSGTIGAAFFRINVGQGNSVVFTDPARKLRFHSLRIGTVAFVDNTAKIRGIGLLNNRRVAFTVFAVHNAQPGVDVFHISWLHGLSIGGRVHGSVFIR